MEPGVSADTVGMVIDPAPQDGRVNKTFPVDIMAINLRGAEVNSGGLMSISIPLTSKLLTSLTASSAT